MCLYLKHPCRVRCIILRFTSHQISSSPAVTGPTTMTLIPWWCLFLHVMGLNGHIYRHGKSWNGYNFHTYPHPAKKPVVPRDIMVDVINNVGLKLLAVSLFILIMSCDDDVRSLADQHFLRET